MKIKKVAQIANISIRTLHHYDEIGLLVPNKDENGYRRYSEADLDRLQLILFYRAIDMPLKEIKETLQENKSDIDKLMAHRQKLLLKQKQIDTMIQLINQTIHSKKEGIKMTNEEKFKGFNFNDNQYEQEAREKFGDQAVDATNNKLNQLKDSEKEQLSADWVQMFEEFNALKDKAVEEVLVLEQTNKFYHFLNHNFGNYSLDEFYGLGDMYTMDERFKENINQYGENLAEFMSAAMKHYATIKS
ncbi:MerR family transcriptional regulator [Macrococcus equi]|uniref:MerR family transcriptional regulator n=1 Tax=Macrococcus equi TaxID=3395462 RepID=UPI0039BDCBBA